MKLTLTQLKNYAAGYVDAAKIAGAWGSTQHNMVGLLDQIGKTVTIDGDFGDKLPMLDADELPLGKTIQEYFIDLTLPSFYNGSAMTSANRAGGLTDDANKDANIKAAGATVVEPALPSVEETVYSFSLGRYKFKTTVPYNNWERACRTGAEAGSISAKVMERFTNSEQLTKYAIKKELLNALIGKATAQNLVSTLAKPSDAESGEKFIKEMKERVEDMSFANEGNCLAGAGVTIGATPSNDAVLFVSKKVMPSLQVDTKAGAFQLSELAIPAKIIVVDDFGSDNTGVYAILCDIRGIRLHPSYHAIRSGLNEDGDFENIVSHNEYTAFLSKYTYVHCFKAE